MVNLKKTLLAGSKLYVVIPSSNGTKKYEITIDEATPMILGKYESLIQKQAVKITKQQRRKKKQPKRSHKNKR